ncbi:MAG: radical SAM protein [Duncaniella sp.]|nr:radical SAM protein [Duncaniella sp.]
MQRVLFHSTIFGPIRSRRLGVSLGINLSPDDGKTCTFDCLYCEAGFNAQGAGKTGLPPREKVRNELENRLAAMHDAGEPLDVITFSGNGEPTLHPEFSSIIDDTIALRDRFYPDAKVSVLCNSTRLDREDVRAALRRVDNAILKLDSALDSTIRLLDRPTLPHFDAATVTGWLKEMGEDGIIQTMMLRGSYEGQSVDNTTEEEIKALIDAYRLIQPREIMLYSIDRTTPAQELVKVPKEELTQIGMRIESETGIPVKVS